MTFMNVRVALGSVRAREGTPFELTDATGKKVLIMYNTGQYHLRNARKGIIGFTDTADVIAILGWMQTPVTGQEVSAVTFEVAA